VTYKISMFLAAVSAVMCISGLYMMISSHKQSADETAVLLESCNHLLSNNESRIVFIPMFSGAGSMKGTMFDFGTCDADSQCGFCKLVEDKK